MNEYLKKLAKKLAELFGSVKFYSLLASLLLDYQQYALGKIDAVQFLVFAIGALSVFATGRAIVEHGLAQNK